MMMMRSTSLNTAWVPLSLLFHASFILILTLSQSSITEANSITKMKIGVPSNTFSDQFGKYEKQSTNNPDKKEFTGFCIRVFEEVVRILNSTYDIQLPYEFENFPGSYDDLVDRVADKTFDAAVGDITVVAKRWKVADFTVPFTETGMTLVVPVSPYASNAWMFLTPFTTNLWLATLAILIYTMFILWLLEHRSNPEFFGPRKDQISNILWFTFSSLFFAHREKIQHNHTRAVMVVWLVVVLVITQSYTANFSSMLTVSRLNADVGSLMKSNATVGYYGTSAVKEYLVKVLHYKEENIRDTIRTQSDYLHAFENGSISAAFLEVPYAQAIVKQHCDQLAVTGPTYEFGGLGFVFQKDSRIVGQVSEAILALLEDGTIKNLEEKWFPTASDCSNLQSDNNNGRRLSLWNFWGLYIVYVATSTICLLLFIVHSMRKQRRHFHEVGKGNTTPTHQSTWKKILPLMQSLNNADSTDPSRVQASPEYIEMRIN